MFGMTMLVLAAGLSAPAARGEERNCRQVDVLVQAPNARNNRPGRSFSAVSVRDLEFVVTMPQKLAGRDLELWVYTPTGHLYQALDVPTEAQPRPKRGRRHVPWGRAGVGHAARVSPSWIRVELSFPVSGTLITGNGLYGDWRVEPHLDRNANRCGDDARFNIKP